jgi:hypothetical protein
MRHVGNLLLCVVDGGDDRGGNLLEAIGETILLRRSLAGLAAALGLCGYATIGIESSERAVALLKNTTSFLDQRLDIVNKFLFVQLVAGCTVGLFDVL